MKMQIEIQSLIQFAALFGGLIGSYVRLRERIVVLETNVQHIKESCVLCSKMHKATTGGKSE